VKWTQKQFTEQFLAIHNDSPEWSVEGSLIFYKGLLFGEVKSCDCGETQCKGWIIVPDFFLAEKKHMITKETEDVKGQRPFDKGILRGEKVTISGAAKSGGPTEVLVGVVDTKGQETVCIMSPDQALELAKEITEFAWRVRLLNLGQVKEYGSDARVIKCGLTKEGEAEAHRLVEHFRNEGKEADYFLRPDGYEVVVREKRLNKKEAKQVLVDFNAGRGHGIVKPRTDGGKAKCLGPPKCSICAEEMRILAKKEGLPK